MLLLIFRETVTLLHCFFGRPPSSVSCKVLLSQEADDADKKPSGGDVADKEGDSVMMLVLRDTVIMLPCTCNFFGRPPWFFFFRFFGPLFLKKKEVILVLLVLGDMTFELTIG